jgi:hypothetical protein
VNIGGSPQGLPRPRVAPSAIPPSRRAPHKEGPMLLNLTSIVLIVLAICGLIKLAGLIHS